MREGVGAGVVEAIGVAVGVVASEIDGVCVLSGSGTPTQSASEKSIALEKSKKWRTCLFRRVGRAAAVIHGEAAFVKG
tara:strand:- start:98 stop:331 length:234 start_codon:yes stop_codon:yes gene_type:complete